MVLICRHSAGHGKVPRKGFGMSWPGRVTRFVLGDDPAPALLLLPLLTTLPTHPTSGAAIGRDDFAIGKGTFRKPSLECRPNLGPRIEARPLRSSPPQSTRTYKGHSHIFSLALPSYSKTYGNRLQRCTVGPTRITKTSNNGTFGNTSFAAHIAAHFTSYEKDSQTKS